MKNRNNSMNPLSKLSNKNNKNFWWTKSWASIRNVREE